MLALAVVLTAVLFAAWRSRPVLNRDGATWARVEVGVRDAATGRPVPGAAVTVLDSSGVAFAPNVSLATPADAAGRAKARVLAGMSRVDHLVYERIGFGTSGESVQVTAPGYAPATVRLPRDGSTWGLPGGRIDALFRVSVDLSPFAPNSQPN
jgi:hypothetical protein